MSSPRTANVDIVYNGKNITTKLSKFIKSFSYTDVASGESDSITLKLHNIDKRWLNKWLPTKGDELAAKIITNNWIQEGKKATLNCGEFVLDDLAFSGRPLTASIGGLSIPAKESFKETERTKTWESVTIESIAKDIAKRSGIQLYYDADTIHLESVEQSGTDCEFLYSLCETYGLSMKVFSSKIIIFDEEDYEIKAPVTTIYETQMLSWNYKDVMAGTYTGAKISYTDGKKAKDITIKVGSGNRILTVNKKADNLKDAELIAKAAINHANKKMTTLKITMVADPSIVATSNVMISGLGKLDGKYAVDKVTHNIGSGYTMNLDLRKIYNRIGSNRKQASSGREYIVKKGDTLWSISKAHYGSGAKYMNIYSANKEVIESAAKARGKESSNKGSLIFEGTKLIIP